MSVSVIILVYVCECVCVLLLSCVIDAFFYFVLLFHVSSPVWIASPLDHGVCSL